MNKAPFLNPRLIGTRFKDGTIPLEFLKDFAVLEKIIVEVAKAEFFKDHPDRQRTPRDFTKGIELKITGIERGSAIPLIVLAETTLTLAPSENQIYFVRARDTIMNATGAAKRNPSIAEYLPEKTLGYFDRIGRGLRADEAIEFRTPDGQVSATLTKETLRRLVRRGRIYEDSPKSRKRTEVTLVRGTIPEVDQDTMTFEIQPIGGHRVKAHIAEQHRDTIISAFNGYKNDTRVLLRGIGQYDGERLLEFDSVEHVNILEDLDVSARLDELRSLQDGWLDGEGIAPTHEGLDWLSRAFDQHYPDDLPLPYLYPMEEGGIQAEWSLGYYEIILEIDLESHMGDWDALDTETDTNDLRTLNLNRKGDWMLLEKKIKEIKGSVE